MKTRRLRAARRLASFPFKAGSIVDKAKGPNGGSVSCLHAIQPKPMVIKVIRKVSGPVERGGDRRRSLEVSDSGTHPNTTLQART